MLALLPEDLLLLLLQLYLPVKSILELSRTCKSLHSICGLSILWRRLCARDYKDFIASTSSLPLQLRKVVESCQFKTAYFMLSNVWNLSGIWIGDYSVHGRELIHFEQRGWKLVATKLTGDRNIPREKVTFEVNLRYSIKKTQYRGTGMIQLAEDGYVRPWWETCTLFATDNANLRIRFKLRFGNHVFPYSMNLWKSTKHDITLETVQNAISACGPADELGNVANDAVFALLDL
jgi:hypothetical protein